MSESQSHINLVNDLVHWISMNHLNNDPGFVLVDKPNNDRSRRPPPIGDYCPDVFVQNPPAHKVIIGEAKTIRDIENIHTLNQFEAFLNFCNLNQPSLFVVAVPWCMSRFARNLVSKIQMKTETKSVETVILQNLRG